MAGYVRLSDHKNSPDDARRAKELRHASSFVEQTLWHELRIAAKPTNIRFRRQHPVHPYIVDFICLKLHLIIEVDGSSHDTSFECDKERENYLKRLGYEIMRFTNGDVMTNRDGVIQAILSRAAELSISLHVPLP